MTTTKKLLGLGSIFAIVCMLLVSSAIGAGVVSHSAADIYYGSSSTKVEGVLSNLDTQFFTKVNTYTTCSRINSAYPLSGVQLATGIDSATVGHSGSRVSVLMGSTTTTVQGAVDHISGIMALLEFCDAEKKAASSAQQALPPSQQQAPIETTPPPTTAPPATATPVCGDGKIEGTEACDGNALIYTQCTYSPDTFLTADCRSDCTGFDSPTCRPMQDNAAWYTASTTSTPATSTTPTTQEPPVADTGTVSSGAGIVNDIPWYKEVINWFGDSDATLDLNLQ